MQVADIVEMLNGQYNDDENILVVIYDRDEIARIASDMDVFINEDTIDGVIEYCESNCMFPSIDDVADGIKDSAGNGVCKE